MIWWEEVKEVPKVLKDSVLFQIHNSNLTSNPNLSVVLYQSTRFVNPPAGANTGNTYSWAE